MTGIGVALVGLLLCFAGVRSIHLALLSSGFALGWLVAEGLGGSLSVTVIVALCSAAVTWVLATLVFRAALFVVGGVAGGVIGAKLFGLLEGEGHSVVLAVVFVVAVAVVAGIATQRYRGRVLLPLVCALGGAGLALSGVARMAPDTLGFLRTPDTAAESVIAGAVWIVLAVAGWSVQRRWAQRKDHAAATA